MDVLLSFALFGGSRHRETTEQSRRGDDVLAGSRESWGTIVVLHDSSLYVMSHGPRMPLLSAVAFDLLLELGALSLHLLAHLI